eukprot:343585-Rhodomonas_salina.1
MAEAMADGTAAEREGAAGTKTETDDDVPPAWLSTVQCCNSEPRSVGTVLRVRRRDAAATGPRS